jgi:hypothetical protein
MFFCTSPFFFAFESITRDNYLHIGISDGKNPDSLEFENPDFTVSPDFGS